VISQHPTLEIEVSALSEKVIETRVIIRGNGGFRFRDDTDELEILESKLGFKSRLLTWERETIQKILSLVENRTLTLAEDERFYGKNQAYQAHSQELALNLVRQLRATHDATESPSALVRQLVARNLLTQEQAATLDLTPPVDAEGIERQRQREQEEAEFKAGFEKLKAAVVAYGKQVGNDWAFRDFLNVWNSKTGRKRNDDGLLEFARDLGSRKLLSIGDRIATDVADLWAKLKELVS
jgi:hypothetical protein